MNIRDVAGVETPQELYEIASKHGIHVGSMDHLVRFAVEIQSRAMVEKIAGQTLETFLIKDTE